MKLCAITDEISRDFEKAIQIGLENGIQAFELRTIYGKRFPFYDEDDIGTLINLREKYQFQISAIVLGVYKIGLEQTPWDDLKQFGYSKIFKLAEKLECPNFIVFASEQNLNENEYRIMIDNIKKFTVRAVNNGFSVLLENSANSYCKSSKKLLEVLNEVSVPGLFIDWNPCNSFCCDSLNIRNDYTRLQPHLKNIHLKDAKTLSNGDKEFVPLNEGEINLNRIFSLLKENGYSQNITIETNCTDSETAFIKSVEYVKGKIRAMA
ncbi:MAG: sugar phosphate isomerase/epimerase [Clostridiales bacterium]|mgnify:CR=1 FL=1|nr:sugar phosphate isomerase/epimerase [Clostridiales bacterium]